ncbi:hypothetical protein [Silvibacterium sp.]|uniref:hypothetical protein n=1 Tax=Silvibacterium sp. TaxID=1964179 RepID=UPI0039E6E335
MPAHGQPKIYPNLNPAAALPVDREQIFSLRNFSEHYRLTRGREHSHYVPNARYVFVTMPGGETLMHPQYRHPVLAQGKPVLYAGEACFNNGQLKWWSNGSGNYRPDAAHAAQAGLPMDHFFSYQEILKGTHTQSTTDRTPKDFHVPGGSRAASPLQASFAQARPGPGGLIIPWGPRDIPRSHRD